MTSTAMLMRHRPSVSGLSIRGRMIVVVLAVAIPMVLLSAVMVGRLAESERQSRRDALIYSARSIATSVDAQIERFRSIAMVLALSPSLRNDDLATFRREAEQMRPTLSGAWLIVADPAGQQLINLQMSEDASLPPRSARAMEVQNQAFKTGQIQLSDVFMGAASQTPVVTIEVPIFRDGAPHYLLAVIMEARLFLEGLNVGQLPEGWLNGIADRRGNYVARSAGDDLLAGTAPSPGWRDTMGQDGVYEFRSREGELVTNANAISRATGWTVGVAARKDAFEAPIVRSIMIVGIGTACVTLLSMLLAGWAARSIIRPLATLERGAQALQTRKLVAVTQTGVPEVDRALDAFVASSEAMVQHEGQRDLFIAELSHRTKNLMAIILSMMRQTSRRSVDYADFERRFTARILALSAVHDVLVQENWEGGSVHEVARTQLSGFDEGSRIERSGDDVMLKPAAVQTIGLALHELVSNSAKYGAMSVPEGRVTLHWRMIGQPGGAPDALRIEWQESGGPPVVPPEHAGFGHVVLMHMGESIGAKATLDYQPAGLVWTLVLQPAYIIRTGTAPS
jgi:two-component sensor histidine kinase